MISMEGMQYLRQCELTGYKYHHEHLGGASPAPGSLHPICGKDQFHLRRILPAEKTVHRGE